MLKNTLFNDDNIGRFVETDVNINYINIFQLDQPDAFTRLLILNQNLLKQDGNYHIQIYTDKKFFALPKTNLLMFDVFNQVLIQGGYFYPVQNNKIDIIILNSSTGHFINMFDISANLSAYLFNSYPIVLSNILDNSLIHDSNCTFVLTGTNASCDVSFFTQFCKIAYGHINIDDVVGVNMIYGFSCQNTNTVFTPTQITQLFPANPADRFKLITFNKNINKDAEMCFIESPDNAVTNNYAKQKFDNVRIDTTAGANMTYYSMRFVF